MLADEIVKRDAEIVRLLAALSADDGNASLDLLQEITKRDIEINRLLALSRQGSLRSLWKRILRGIVRRVGK
jgi:hypothetical protein